MNSWVYITGGLCLLLLCFLLWKEATRNNKGRRGLRLLTTLFAVVSLYLMAVPIMYTSTGNITSSNEAILLTEGTSSDSLSQFVNATGKSFPVLTFDEKIAATRKFGATRIIDPQDLIAKKYSAIHVFGYGIGQDELPEQPIVFHPSPLPTGFTSIHWQRTLSMGDQLTMQGNFHNANTSPVKITLTGYNNLLDSITIPALSDQVFQLTTIPKQLGRGVYSLSAVVKKDTIIKEPVPIQVIPSSPLKILLLIASPDFENKFLKNWLAEKGYEVVVRTTVSKNKTSKEYLNTAAINIDNITPDLLDRFDITIADAAELSSFSSGEIQSLRTAVSQKGKGLIIRTDSAASRNAFYATLFPLTAIDTGTQHTINLRMINGNTILQPLNLIASYAIRVQAGTQPLIADKENHILVNSALSGSGKILLSTLPNTFSWVLSGNQSDYDQVWSELITKASPQKMVEEAWHVAPALPHINQPVTILLESNSSNMPAAQLAGATINLSNAANLPFRWSGLFWPMKEGWQTGIQLNGGVYYWYAYAPDDWKSISATAKNRITQQASHAASFHHTAVNPAGSRETATFPAIIFFLIFLGSCGYLWFENKYYNS